MQNLSLFLSCSLSYTQTHTQSEVMLGSKSPLGEHDLCHPRRSVSPPDALVHWCPMHTPGSPCMSSGSGHSWSTVHTQNISALIWLCSEERQVEHSYAQRALTALGMRPEECQILLAHHAQRHVTPKGTSPCVVCTICTTLAMLWHQISLNQNKRLSFVKKSWHSQN